MNPIATVVVPVFNGARFLAQALDSALAQDAQPIEVIVVDDGSSDDSAEIAASREVLVVRQQQRGVAVARNVGIAASRSPIVALLDQDDLWLPSKLRRQIDALLSRPEHVSLTLQEYFLEPPLTAAPPWMRPEMLEAPHVGWGPSCLAFRRETFERVGEFDERYRQASDADWIARAKGRGVVFEAVDELLVRRRVHALNDSAAPTAIPELMKVIRDAARRRNLSE